MSLRDEIDNARRTHDMRDVLGTDKKYLLCPLPMHVHQSNTPSFMIFWRDGVQYFRCHGNCGRRGDVVDLVGYLRIPGYNRKDGRMVARALELLDTRYEQKIVVPEKEVQLAPAQWIDFLPPRDEVVAYAAKRGLREETLKRFAVGQRGRYMTIPCFEEQQLAGIKCRNTSDVGIRFFQLPGSRQGLFNYDAIVYQTGPVFVVKGEIPAMLLAQYGYAACAPTGGESGWREVWRTALALASCIVVADNDTAGRTYGERRAALLDALLKFPPPRYKDWDEWLLAEPEECLAVTERWKQEAEAKPY